MCCTRQEHIILAIILYNTTVLSTQWTLTSFCSVVLAVSAMTLSAVGMREHVVCKRCSSSNPERLTCEIFWQAISAAWKKWAD